MYDEFPYMEPVRRSLGWMGWRAEVQRVAAAYLLLLLQRNRIHNVAHSIYINVVVGSRLRHRKMAYEIPFTIFQSSGPLRRASAYTCALALYSSIRYFPCKCIPAFIKGYCDAPSGGTRCVYLYCVSEGERTSAAANANPRYQEWGEVNWMKAEKALGFFWWIHNARKRVQQWGPSKFQNHTFWSLIRPSCFKFSGKSVFSKDSIHHQILKNVLIINN